MWGHEVRTTHDGPSALELAAEFRPDAVLLDIGLPRMDGFEVAERLRALPEFERTLIVGSSGYSRESDRRRAAEVGIDLYFVKPFDPWQLESILDSHRATLEADPRLIRLALPALAFGRLHPGDDRGRPAFPATIGPADSPGPADRPA